MAISMARTLRLRSRVPKDQKSSIGVPNDRLRCFRVRSGQFSTARIYEGAAYGHG
jgi:hypothetical protein